MNRVRDLQAPLRARYKSEPSAALVVDRARSAAHDPGDAFHAMTKAQGAPSPQQVAVHAGHGGPHDGATPGDILCAAFCCCYELTIRMVAGGLGLEVAALDVAVEGEVDLRGSLGMQDAPVGFRVMRVNTHLSLRGGGPPEVGRVLHTAEALCVVGQTLAAGVRIEHSSVG